MAHARIVEVIETSETRGEGLDMRDPVRIVEQWFRKDGELLFERDPHGTIEAHRQYCERADTIDRLEDELDMVVTENARQAALLDRAASIARESIGTHGDGCASGSDCGVVQHAREFLALLDVPPGAPPSAIHPRSGDAPSQPAAPAAEPGPPQGGDGKVDGSDGRTKRAFERI